MTTTGGTRPTERGPRADSVRNRVRILEAAEAVFGEEGISVPIDRVAERAGVGVGTLYRHFPTKEALFEAIVLRHFARLVEHARDLEQAPDAAAALHDFLAEMVEVATAKRDFAEALIGAGIDLKATAGELKAQLDAALESTFARAQRDGSIRPEVSFVDLMGLVGGACLQTSNQFGPVGCSPARMLGIVFGGLRTEG
ncbi:MAG: TetR/AcrR family transcriptional regulator [Acidimicrobiales bacterium]